MINLEKLIESVANKLTEEEYDAIAQLEWEKGVSHGNDIAFDAVIQMLKKRASDSFLKHDDSMADFIRVLISETEKIEKKFKSKE